MGLFYVVPYWDYKSIYVIHFSLINDSTLEQNYHTINTIATTSIITATTILFWGRSKTRENSSRNDSLKSTFVKKGNVRKKPNKVYFCI